MTHNLFNPFLKSELNVSQLSEKEYELLIRQAKSANMAALLANHILGHSIDTPEKGIHHLKSEQLLTSRQIEAVKYELEKLKVALQHINTKTILLKGAAYIALDFEFAKYRNLSDIDILVEKDSLKIIERELIFFGWAPHEIDDYDENYYREWMHEIPPLKHRLRSSVIDVHHNIFPPVSGISPDANLLINDAVYLEDIGMWVLCNEDMFIHSAVHFFMQSEINNGLRDLHDMKELFIMFNKINAKYPTNLLIRAKKLGMTEPVTLALRYINKVFNISYNEGLALQIKQNSANNLFLKWFDYLFLNILTPHHKSTINVHFKFSEFIIYWRGHMKKMPITTLINHLIIKSIKNISKKTEVPQ